MSITEQQLAELELLSQSQLKLNQLTGRITSILSGFDGRLRGLESSIVPLHRTTQRLVRASHNIDRTLQALERTETQQASIADLEPAIRKGPSARDVQAYFRLLDEVKTAMGYVETAGSSGRRIAEMMDIGANRLADLVRSWIEAESQPIDPNEHLQRGMPLPAFSDVLLQAIIPILNYLSDMRTDGTYLLGAFNVYIGVRSTFLVSSLQSLHTSTIEYTTARSTSSASSDDALENGYLRGMAGFETLFAATYELGNNELQKATQVVSSIDPLPPAEVSQSTIAIVAPPLAQLVSTSTNIASTLTRSNAHPRTTKNLATLSFHVGMVFDFVGTLSQYLPLVAKAFTAGGDAAGIHQQKGETDGSLRELKAVEKTQQRQLCTACFRQIIDTLRNAPAKYADAEGTASTMVHDISYDGLRVILQIWEYRRFVGGPVLQSMGAGNWMQAPGSAAPQLDVKIATVGGDQRAEEEEQHQTLIAYLNDVLATMLSALEVRSKSIRQASTASIFLLNNVGFLKRELSSHAALENPEDGTAQSMVDVMGIDCADMLEGTLKMASQAYLDAWSPCVSALMEDVPLNASAHHTSASKANKLASAMGAHSSDKSVVKDRLATFYEALDEMAQLLRAFPLSQEDVDLKAKLLRDVSRMVCPLYNRFVAKHRMSGFSKDPSKHIRMTEKEVALRIEDMFR